MQAEYRPSELLCPRALCWVPAERALAAIDASSYVTISELPGALEGLGLEQARPAAVAGLLLSLESRRKMLLQTCVEVQTICEFLSFTRHWHLPSDTSFINLVRKAQGHVDLLFISNSSLGAHYT